MYTVFLRGRWCNVIVLNVHASSEGKRDYKKESMYEELEQVLDLFHRYHMKILLGNFNAKLEKRGFFKTTAGNESLHQDSNDNGVRIVNIAT